MGPYDVGSLYVPFGAEIFKRLWIKNATERITSHSLQKSVHKEHYSKVVKQF